MEKWTTIKKRIETTLKTRGLKNPNIRLNALKSIDSILDDKYKVEPLGLLKIDKKKIKEELSRKKGSNLNSAESSIINHIYDVINDKPLPIKEIEYQTPKNKTISKKENIDNGSIVSFAPFIPLNIKILILGTMPGDDSLQTFEYYHKPQNCFWKIIFDLFSPNTFSNDYKKKLNILANNHIGLWDVLSNCNRKGSLDADITDEEFNDIDALLKKNPDITKIIFNGGKASKYFAKANHKTAISNIILPSTSSSNRKPYAEKLKEWKSALIENNQALAK
jgi:hypoxanthine-DNA glycosylase